jgi:hypothetical protein
MTEHLPNNNATLDPETVAAVEEPTKMKDEEATLCAHCLESGAVVDCRNCQRLKAEAQPPKHTTMHPALGAPYGTEKP